ncbi:mandelate racemase/muconate lactonizing enzyme family protein [Paenibacillus lycopersici]|uniref:Mandelate racemase/muconate lactonizing enzyme family protein n=1 Tax=Paenibacillus lycopersici TaxID=2704462 RepID=A0A6C0G385_9BACL|nr:mandelate racemase/muconate lactonizing enzyme family protein [Paenibacillus lycopersici]QHT62453.1 mandelate racemase/muconate lactonizing enzyme family protein [Paenibacillus lycopersici]
MKITGIELSILESPYDYGIDAGNGDSRGPKYALIVQLHTDEGITGIADCDSHPHVMKAFIDAPRYIAKFSEGLKYAVLGQNPFEYEKIWRAMYQSAFYQGRRGAAIHAMSAIDIAIWDIIGKATGNPVSVMLGGRSHERLTAYASTLFRGTPAEMKDAVQKYRGMGFRAMKFGWGVVAREPRKVVELVAAAREAAGSEMEIMVDGMWSADVKLVIQLVKELERYGVFFVEEPLHSDNLSGYRKLADSVDVRIACGEQLGGMYEYEQLIREGGVDVIQPDISRMGGLTEARRLVDLVEQSGKMLIPHAWTSDVLTAASLHLNAYQKHPYFQEFCTNDTPLSRELVCEPLRLEPDGTLVVPNKPGIGLELNHDVVARYTVEHALITDLD